MRIPSTLLILASAAFAQDQQFANLGDFKLRSGELIRDCKIGYRTYGTLNAAKSNAILFPTWFSGASENLAAYIGPDKLADSARFFVIAVDALGNGVSSSPSNGAKPFPKFTIRDMVDSQHALLTRHLGIAHLRAVIGISMGGMQTFEWMVAYPEFMDRAVPIIGSPRLATADLLLWQAQLSAIETARDPAEGMRTVAAIHQFALHTPEWRSRETPNAKFREFKETSEKGLVSGRMKPEDWASQLRAMMAANVAASFGDSLDKAAAEVRAETLVVVAMQDHMVNPGPAIEFAGYMGAGIVRLEGNCGHMAVGCESERVVPAVRRFLEQ